MTTTSEDLADDIAALQAALVEERATRLEEAARAARVEAELAVAKAKASDDQAVIAHPRRRARLLSEHTRRRGDPSPGGSTRQPVMTAYRQRALACAAMLRAGPCRPRDLRVAASDAGRILRRNVYGWFERPAPGMYRLTGLGEAALQRWAGMMVDAEPEIASAARGDAGRPEAVIVAMPTGSPDCE